MKCLVVAIAILLTFSKIERASCENAENWASSSSSSSSNEQIPSLQELDHLSNFTNVRGNISDNFFLDHDGGRKPGFRIHRVALTSDESLARSIEQPSLRIYNGDPATLGNIPFIVRIYIFKSSFRYLCGGSILSEHWVVTAAHCVMDQAQYRGTNHSFTIHGPSIQIIAGDVAIPEYERSTVVKSVTQVYTHENYNPWYLQSDIALLYIEDGFDFSSPYIKKINIADVQPDAGSSVTIAGWGQQENEKVAPTLQYATYTVPEQTYCKQIYRSKGYYILPGMLCTGDDQMITHSALGDSGGPVFRDHGQNNFTLFGLVSWGVESDVGAYDYDVNADMAYYRRWALSIMESYKQYRVQLFAEINTKTMSWRSGTDTFRYQIYNISCEAGRFVKVMITALVLSSDYTHVILRDGDQYDSPVLLQQLHNLSDGQTLSATSTSNKLLMLIRTTNSYNDKLVRFFYSSVSTPIKSSDAVKCGDQLKVCDNKWECYDPLYQCDGEIADCSDWSDEEFCSDSTSSRLPVMTSALLGLLVMFLT